MWIPSRDGSGWAKPAFTPDLSPKHKTCWRTAGTLMLLHILTLANGPKPISPFLIFLLLAAASLQGERTLGQEDVLVCLGSLYQLDPRTANILRPWMVLKETDKLSGFDGGQVLCSVMTIQSLLNNFEFQISPISHSSKAAVLNRSQAVDHCGD